jgi:hypothetical protein
VQVRVLAQVRHSGLSGLTGLNLSRRERIQVVGDQVIDQKAGIGTS